MRKVGLVLIHIILLVVFCEFIYGIALDPIVYNAYALNNGLAFFYHTLPALTAILLSVVLLFVFSKVPVFVRQMMLVLVNLYLYLCMVMAVFGNCDPKKNLDAFHSGVVSILMLITAFILIKKILPEMRLKDILIVACATIISLIDFTYTMFGYQLFYPGNW